MMAAREGRTEVVSLLLEAGANTDLQNMVNCVPGGVVLELYMYQVIVVSLTHFCHHTVWRLCTDDGCQDG